MISSVPAFPAIAGNRARIRTLAEAVRYLGHELSFVLLPAQADMGDAEAHRAAFGADNFTVLENGGGGFDTRRKLARGWRKGLRKLGVAAGEYTGLDALWNPAWDAQIAQLTAGMDAVIVEYVFNSRAFASVPAGVRKILDTHDSFGDRHLLYRQQGLSGGNWVSLRRADQARGLRRADVVLAIQGDERDHFASELAAHPGSPSGDETTEPEIAVLSHVLDLSGQVTDVTQDQRGLFIGSRNSANIKAVETLVHDILPRIVKTLPQFELALVGSIAEAAPDHPNLRRLGRVDDLHAAFRAAPLMLNPINVGTGIAIKLLDALAAGIPTVSTVTGARGLPETAGNGIRLVPDNDPEAFASAAIALAQDSAARTALGAAAYAEAKAWNDAQYAALGRCLD